MTGRLISDEKQNANGDLSIALEVASRPRAHGSEL